MPESEIKKATDDLVEACRKGHVPLFISVGAEKKKIHTVTPEEVGLKADKTYNEFIRVLSGFDKESLQ